MRNITPSTHLLLVEKFNGSSPVEILVCYHEAEPAQPVEHGVATVRVILTAQAHGYTLAGADVTDNACGQINLIFHKK